MTATAKICEQHTDSLAGPCVEVGPRKPGYKVTSACILDYSTNRGSSVMTWLRRLRGMGLSPTHESANPIFRIEMVVCKTLAGFGSDDFPASRCNSPNEVQGNCRSRK